MKKIAFVVVVMLGALAFSPPSAVDAEPGESPAGTDATGMTPPAKPKYPNLQGQLSEVAEAAEADASTGIPAAPGAPSSVAVTIHFSGEAASFEDAIAATPGVIIAHVLTRSIEAYVPVSELAAVSEMAGVTRVAAILPPQPDVTSEGTTVHNSPAWNAYGFTGAGVKVGILDAGFDGWEEVLGTELPAPVAAHCYTSIGFFTTNFADCQAGSNHGTAIAESLVDIAPDVSLYVANPKSQGALQAAAIWMISQGVTIINHSMTWPWVGPGDGTTPFADTALDAVDSAVALGATWINSAGNSARRSWTGPGTGQGYQTIGSCGTQNILTLAQGATYTFQLRWEDSWEAAARDLDLQLFNPSNTQVAASADIQAGEEGDIPYEIITYTAPVAGAYRLAIFHGNAAASGSPAWIDLQGTPPTGTALEFSCFVLSNSVNVPGESSNPGMVTVGASYWATPTAISATSGRGPTRDGRIKPDVVATDGGQTATLGGWFGTSQAAAHMSGMAAIALQIDPDLDPDDVADLLRDRAEPRGDPIPNNAWGWGLVVLPTIEGALQLQFDPTGAAPGVPFAGQPVVTLVDENGQVQADDDTTVVTLSLQNGAGAALTCDGGLVKQVTDGVAAFTGCSVNIPRLNLVLAASADCACAGVTSAPFSVLTSQPAEVVFAAFSAEGAVAGAPLAQSPVVHVLDSEGALTTANNSTIVTLTLENASGATLSCDGGLQKQVSGGVATFENCSIDQPGTGYAISADGSCPCQGSTTAAFDVRAPIRQGHFSLVALGDEVALVGRSPGNDLWLRETDGGEWGPWTMVETGGNVGSRPIPAVAGNGDLYVFYRGVANDLAYAVRDAGSGTWTAASLGGSIIEDPVAARDGTGDIVVIAAGPGGTLWQRLLPAGSGTFAEWTAIGGAFPNAVMTLASHDGDLVLIGLDSATAVYTRTWDDASNAWGDWVFLGGGVSSLLDTASHGGELYFVVLGGGGAPYYQRFSDGAWSGWFALAGGLETDIVAASTGDALVVAGVNDIGASWSRSTADGETWGDWTPLDGVVATSPDVVAAGSTAFYAALNPEGTPWVRRWTSGGGWQPWENLGGALATD